jgi:putative CocE/NonD family hydrolase
MIWFQTPPLSEDLTVVGDVTAVLWISSTAPDTDFVVKLFDIHPPTADFPNGYALLLSRGMLRARYREAYSTPKLLVPGEIYRVDISLPPLANRFLAGHRIGAYICSSNFPDSDINRNIGDRDPYLDRRWRVAENTIYHDRDHPSHILLPQWEGKKESE